MTDWRLLLPLVGGGMVFLNSVLFLELFPQGSGLPSRGRAVVLCFLFAASAGLWGSVLFDLWAPGASALIVTVVGLNLMATGPLLVFGLRRWRSRDHPVSPSVWVWPFVLASFLMLTEVLMSADFQYLDLGRSAFWPPGPGGAEIALVQTFLSPWFLWGMAIAMIVILAWVPLPRTESGIFLALTGADLLGPFALSRPLGVTLAMGGLMLAALGFIVEGVRAGRRVEPGFVRLGQVALVVFGLMSTTELLSFLDRTSLTGQFPFALTMVGTMLLEMAYLVQRIWELHGDSSVLSLWSQDDDLPSLPTPTSPP